MRQEKKYLPLEELKYFEKKFPNVFEQYDLMLESNDKNGMSKSSISYSLARYFLMQVYHRSEKSMRKNDIWECMYLILTYCEWKKSKQVYTFSNELFQMISHSEEYSIDGAIFDYLPYDSFYLENEMNNVVRGIFVTHAKEQTSNVLVFVLLFEEHQFCVLTLNLNEVTSAKQFLNKIQYSYLTEEEVRSVLNFAIQACMYLCAKNCDVVENAYQKSIHHPTPSHSNRFSEIRKWDVGFRIAVKHNGTHSSNYHSENAQIRRNRPRQHWRKAHWHTYWVGPARKRKEIKFIAPILVNDIDDEIPVVVHPS